MISVNEIAKAFRRKAAHIEGYATHAAKGQFNAGTAWLKAHYAPGLPVVILPAITDAKTLAARPSE